MKKDKYSTGELAEKGAVSVRTIQFYDKEGLLAPSQISEGGRRLYTTEDEGRLRLILEYKNLGLSLEEIKGVLKEKNPYQVLGAIFQAEKEKIQEETTKNNERNARLDEAIAKIARGEPLLSFPSIEVSGNDRKRLHRTHGILLTLGIAMDLIQLAAILIWVFLGIYWPFIVGMGLVIVLGVALTGIYYRRSAFLCPVCGTRFSPRLGEFVWARHDIRTRRLLCPHCGEKHYCVEIPKK